LVWLLLVCAACVLWEARTPGGYRNMEEPTGSERGYWPGFAWMSVALLSNAALITTIGFILSCTLCFMLAVRGLRNADRHGGDTWAGARRGGADGA
jgi:putative tricarboxylic transport membrane protein